MNRRNFLQIVTFAAGALAITPLALAQNTRAKFTRPNLGYNYSIRFLDPVTYEPTYEIQRFSSNFHCSWYSIIPTKHPFKYVQIGDLIRVCGDKNWFRVVKKEVNSYATLNDIPFLIIEPV